MTQHAQVRISGCWPFAMLAMLAWASTAVAATAEPGPSVLLPVAEIESRLRGPLEIVGMEQARPTIEGDRSARVELAGPEGAVPMAVRWKPVAPPGEGFNNEPRYELAAYRLQKLFLDECEYVVPPVVLRALPVADYRKIRGDAPPTLRGSGAVVFLLSYWLSDVTPREPWSPERFADDPRYARHWANLNILTHIIDHKDSNLGNLLISKYEADPRVFAVDNDVAFASRVSDLGSEWRELLVDRLPRATIERLRKLTLADLERELGVVAEFQLVNGRLELVDNAGGNAAPRRGVLSSRGRVQFGLTEREIAATMGRIDALLARVDQGELHLVEDTPASLGLACAGAAAP
jgi:hypothetical protein